MVPSQRTHSPYEHSVLVHDTDHDLVENTVTFVEHGLDAGAHVLVHGTVDRIELLRTVLGSHPRLEYGFDEELYRSPTKTLFAYQRQLAESAQDGEYWVTGTVPLGHDVAAQAAWARYESAVNEALGAFPFRALCTYDARTSPAAVIAGARATHPSVTTSGTSRVNGQYVDPTAFLTNPLAQVPQPPCLPPSLAVAVDVLEQLAPARTLVRKTASRLSAVPLQSIEEFVIAVSEVVANGVVHGAPPVHLTLWADLDVLTCRVVDSGPGTLDPLSGFRYPDESSPLGLWATRQLVDDMFIGRSPRGGCSVLLTKT